MGISATMYSLNWASITPCLTFVYICSKHQTTSISTKTATESRPQVAYGNPHLTARRSRQKLT